MAEEKKKRIRGFASVVSKQIEPLNEIEKFKEDFKDRTIKILLNATDGKNAALIIIDKGTICVEEVENNPKENLKKKKVGWDGRIQAKTNDFVELLTSEDLSIGSVVGKVLTFKIRIRGLFKALTLLELFNY
ncbi:MAG: hypothetical protein HWN79_01910 [Candidatus Lokiarchaeota archaeon]|nr:hypothetical protein [Candidatus Lokiarchaeota archaeon]